MPSRRITVLYGTILHILRCNTLCFIDNRRQENDCLGRIGVSGQISSPVVARDIKRPDPRLPHGLLSQTPINYREFSSHHGRKVEMLAKLTRTKDNIRINFLSAIGVNPYANRTVGSYLWKEKGNSPLSEEEMSFRKIFAETPNPLSKYLEAERSLAVASAWFGLVGELISDLPHPLRERFMGLPLHQARKETNEILLLADYARGRRTVSLTNRAWIMSITALSVSGLTLLMSASTLYISLMDKP